MHRLIITILLALCTAATGFAGGDDDNIVIEKLLITYDIKSRNGKIDKITFSKDMDFTALRTDAQTYAIAPYNESLTIDKASGSGKPIYRQIEDDDMFYQGQRVCAVPMEIKKGKRSRASFRQTFVEPAQFCNIRLLWNYKVLEGDIVIKVPADVAGKVRAVPYHLSAGMSLDSIVSPSGAKEYRVRLKDIPPYRHEAGAPAFDVEGPQVFVSGVFADIQELYDFMMSKVKGGEPVADIALTAHRVCLGAPDHIARADSITSWVRQNIRYVAVEHGEYGLSPATASDVMSNRYGDCKGSASLIKAMLKSVGIDGRLVWIGTREDTPFKWSEMPTLASGNHMIAAAVLQDTILFLDGTAAYAPAGYIPCSIRGQQAMIENGDTPLLCTVPDIGNEHNAITSHLTINGNDLCGNYERRMYGESKIAIAHGCHYVDARRREKVFELFLSGGRKNRKVDRINYTTGSPCAADAVLSAHIIDTGAVQTIGNRMYIDLKPLGVINLQAVDMKDRTHGLQSRTPSTFAATYTIEIPEGYSAEDLPSGTVATPWFDASVTYTAPGDGTITCSSTLVYAGDAVPFERLEEYNSAVREVKKLINTRIAITHQ